MSDADSSSRNRWPETTLAEVAAAFASPSLTYGTGEDLHARHARDLVRHATPQPGERVLDVATGTAPSAIASALAVGEQGHVIGVDLSPGMLAMARRHIDTAGVRIELLEGDGTRLPFPTASFDLVICASSLAWFPDCRAALIEWHRVLRPGGRLAFSSLAASALPFGRLLRRLLARDGIAFPDLNAPLATPRRCRALLRETGFVPNRITTVDYGGLVTTPETAWETTGGLLVPAPGKVDSWNALQTNPVVLWSRVRRSESIPVPLTIHDLHRLRDDFLADAEHRMTVDGIPNAFVTLLVLARRP